MEIVDDYGSSHVLVIAYVQHLNNFLILSNEQADWLSSANGSVAELYKNNTFL